MPPGESISRWRSGGRRRYRGSRWRGRTRTPWVAQPDRPDSGAVDESTGDRSGAACHADRRGHGLVVRARRAPSPRQTTVAVGASAKSPPCGWRTAAPPPALARPGIGPVAVHRVRVEPRVALAVRVAREQGVPSSERRCRRPRSPSVVVSLTGRAPSSPRLPLPSSPTRGSVRARLARPLKRSVPPGPSGGRCRLGQGEVNGVCERTARRRVVALRRSPSRLHPLVDDATPVRSTGHRRVTAQAKAARRAAIATNVTR